MLSRRQVIRGSAAFGLASLSAGCSRQAEGARLPEIPAGNRAISLAAAPVRRGLDGNACDLWLDNERLFPVLRLQHGEAIDVTLKNNLAEHTSVPWHGVRVPNAMDGVPYLTQPPVEPGKSFRYVFTPPDAGTFFFHPHCDSAAQLGR